MTKVIILGAGNALYDIIELLEYQSEVKSYEVYDDNWQNIEKIKVYGSFDDGIKLRGKNTKFIFGFGTAKTTRKRQDIFEKYELGDEDLISLFHPSSVVSSYAKIAKGVIIKANAVVLPNANISRNVIISQLCSVSHHVNVGAHSILAPSASCSGGSSIGDSCFIGTNASINENVTIGAGSIVGIGAIVRKSLDSGSVKLR